MVLQLGYEFAGTAASADIALNRPATLTNPDLVLLDLNLNGASSEPIADQLVSSGVPLIFVSGYGSGGLSERYAGTEVIQKPYSDAELANALERVFADGAHIRRADGGPARPTRLTCIPPFPRIGCARFSRTLFSCPIRCPPNCQ